MTEVWTAAEFWLGLSVITTLLSMLPPDPQHPRVLTQRIAELADHAALGAIVPKRGAS